MQDFVYQSAPMRVVFGTGTLRQLPDASPASSRAR